MKVLVTGCGGNLGRAALSALVEAGHMPRGMDFREAEVGHEFVLGDVRRPADVARALEGCDAIVHAAAIHGIHLENWSPEDFFEINAHGTFNVYEAAREAGVDRVVLSSTMAVYGESMQGTEDGWAWVTEESPALPADVYGLSKWLCEQAAAFYARVHGISTVALRLGMFVPAGFEHYGFRLLFGGVDERDVAQAVVLSLAHEPEGGFDVFDIMADVPFARDDAKAMAVDPLEVIERHWPGATALFRGRGVDPSEHLWGRTLWPIEKARDVLGYRPRWNFREFLDALAKDARDRYPFLDLPWWGI